jgi:hypothetical protein
MGGATFESSFTAASHEAMGAAISLKLALDAKVKRMSVAVKRMSFASRRQSADMSRQGSCCNGSPDVEMPTSAGSSCANGGSGGSGEGGDGDDAEGGGGHGVVRSAEKPKSRLLSGASSRFGTPWDVVTSKFVWYQVFFNMVSSTLCSLGMFYLLFVIASVPPSQRHSLPDVHWYTPHLVGVVVGSAIFVSPMLVMILAPAGLPEAVEQNWVRIVRVEDCPPLLLRVMPFLGEHKVWRIGCARHLALGILLLLVIVPPTLFLGYLFANGFMDGSPPGYMRTWTLIGFDIVFETLLAIPCTVVGLLAFCMEPNYDRVKATMSMEKHPGKRIWYRILGCLRLLW